MADNHGAATADDPMDMAAHEATYVGFLELTQTVVMVILSIVLMLVLWTLKGHGFIAFIGFVLTAVAAALGGLTGLGWKAVAPVFVLLGLACIVL
jgi:Bacterial aa3 type cytochrome c oxidase subunit IV